MDIYVENLKRIEADTWRLCDIVTAKSMKQSYICVKQQYVEMLQIMKFKIHYGNKKIIFIVNAL